MSDELEPLMEQYVSREVLRRLKTGEEQRPMRMLPLGASMAEIQAECLEGLIQCRVKKAKRDAGKQAQPVTEHKHTPGLWELEIFDEGRGGFTISEGKFGDEDYFVIAQRNGSINPDTAKKIADYAQILQAAPELLAEIERLKACAERTAKVKGKTISVEMPTSENGMRFFVSAPHLTNEETLAETLKNALVLLCEVMTGMKESTK